MKIIIFLFCVLVTPLLAASFEPSIVFQGNKISATTPKGLPVEGQNIEILSSVDCATKIDSKASIQVPANCAYLHGLYRFVFVSKEIGYKQQILTDFSLTRGKNGAQTFLVGESMDINEKRFPALP